jgi:hypothetical protein
MMRSMDGGPATIVSATALFLVGLFGVRSGRALGAWSAVLAVSGAGIAIGCLLVQDQVDTASWIIAPVAGAILAPVHARVLFAPGGPFRT